ncbi:MAG: PaaI family thioesterase [Rhodobacteraceae bacterium]|nr:PaaI family thioesterase [Paracoccaceae bacterium]
MTSQKEKIARQFTAALPFCKALDMRIDETGPGMAALSMPFDDKLVGDPDTGVVHGGAVSALLDSCAGTAVFLHPEGTMPTATIDLRIDYMRPANPGDRIFARAEVYKTTHTVAFVRALAWDDDADHPVATATGAFTFSQARAAEAKS